METATAATVTAATAAPIEGTAANDNTATTTSAAEPKVEPKSEPKASLEERVAKAEAAAQRKTTRARADRQALRELQQQHQAAAAERDTHKSEAEKYKAALARLQDGDESALEELGMGDLYDRLTQARLQPEEVKKLSESKKQLSATEERLKRLEEERDQERQARQRQAVERENTTLIELARDPEALERVPELAALDDDEILAMARQALPELVKGGKSVTFAQVLEHLNEQVAPYNARVIKAYEARKAREASKASEASKAGEASKAAPPASAAEPSTITAEAATTTAAPRKATTDEERRQAAIAKAREVLNKLPRTGRPSPRAGSAGLQLEAKPERHRARHRRC
jgi:hypothetical protein